MGSNLLIRDYVYQLPIFLGFFIHIGPIFYLFQGRFFRNKSWEHFHINNSHVGDVAVSCITKMRKVLLVWSANGKESSEWHFLAPSNPVFLPTAAEQQLTPWTWILSRILYQIVNARGQFSKRKLPGREDKVKLWWKVACARLICCPYRQRESCSFFWQMDVVSQGGLKETESVRWSQTWRRAWHVEKNKAWRAPCLVPRGWCWVPSLLTCT